MATPGTVVIPARCERIEPGIPKIPGLVLLRTSPE
jgi:hypothetical protein